MKLSFLFLIIPLIQVTASSKAQTITLNKQNVSISAIFEEIMMQSDYDFSYSEQQISKVGLITISVTKASITEVLDKCFKGQPLTYSINGKNIIITAKKTSLFQQLADKFSNIDIQGTIVDETGSPLVGATVKLQGTQTTTRTNEQGFFSLTSEKNSGIMIITYLGYQTEQISFHPYKLGPFKVILKEGQSELKEVEVVSTGYQNISKERATGSFTQIDNKTINRNVGINILDRLESVTSGLLLNKGLTYLQGDANNSKISVRGRSTIFANVEPLIVLDGFPYDGTIDQINPADIENISILKDAAAASIWGTRAGNGVIVITSKRGRNNQKLGIEINSTLTVSTKPDLYYAPTLSSSEYVDLEQYLFSKGYYEGNLSTPYTYITPVIEILNQRRNNVITSADSASKINALKGQDVRKDLERYGYRPAVYQQYQMNLRGGSTSNRYYMSGGYDKNLESTVSDSYDRLTLSANNVYSLYRNKLEIISGVNFTSSKIASAADTYRPSQPYTRLVDDYGNSLPVSSSDNLRLSYVDTAGNGQLLDWYFRPKDEFKPNSIRNQIQYKINLGIDYKILDGLNLTGNYQYLKEKNERILDYDIQSHYARNLINSYSSIVNNEVIRGIPLGVIINKGETDYTSKIARFQLSYNKVFGHDHEINAITGYEGSDSRISSIGLMLYGFDPGIQTNGNNLINPLKDYPYYYEPGYSSRFQTAPSLGESINIIQSYYANVSYTFKDKYILSGSARRDESNLFGVKTNQKGVPLWSAGVAWIINRESLFRIDWLSSLKLRATYGYNGNVDKSVSGFLTVLNLGFINDWGNTYSEIANPPNPLLRWEKVKTWNLGLDFTLKNNRVSGSVDLYQKDAIDLIGNNPIAMQSGVTQFRGNGASLRTKGIDVTLNSRNLNGKFQWLTSLLLNYNSDKVISYKIKQSANSDLITNNFANPLEGYPYYAVFSFPSAGLDATGSPQGCLNGLISNDYAKIASTFDPAQLKFHGSASPKYFGSVINTFSYNNLELSFNIVYKFNYYFRRSNTFDGFGFNGTVADYDKRWQKVGDELITRVPAFKYPQESSVNFFRNSEDVVERGDHIRLQDIRLSYKLSQSSYPNSPFKNVSIFLYGKNLGILWRETDYKIDPDYGTASIPQPLSISLGINLQF